MCNGPAKRRDRRLLVYRFVQIEEMMNGFVFRPVDGDGKPLFRCPTNDLKELVLCGSIRGVVVIHGAGYSLADSVESQHVVAESHRQELREISVLLEFGADVLREQAE